MESQREAIARKPQKSSPSTSWYAVYTRPRAEKQVYTRLLEQGIEAYLPLQKRVRRWSDRRKLVEVPLFSSYVFVKIDRRVYDSVLKTHGVVKFISFEGKAATIPQAQIDNLKIVVDSDAEVETTWEKHRRGDRVRVTAGSLRGLEGELISDGGRKKVLVRIDKLEQNLVLEVPLGIIEKTN